MEQKVSGNSFRKFLPTSRGCPLFGKFGNSRNSLFHLAFLPRYESAPVPLLVKSHKIVDWSFRICGLVRPVFLFSSGKGRKLLSWYENGGVDKTWTGSRTGSRITLYSSVFHIKLAAKYRSNNGYKRSPDSCSYIFILINAIHTAGLENSSMKRWLPT